MKKYMPITMSILALFFCRLSMLEAQYYPLGPTQGMFGYRTLGQPQWGFTTQGMFGYRTLGQPQWGMATNGMFGNRLLGQTVAISPIYAFGIQPGIGITVPYAGQAPGYQLAPTSQTPFTQYNPYFPAEFVNPYDLNAGMSPATGRLENAVPASQGPGTAVTPSTAYTPGMNIAAGTAQAAGMNFGPGNNLPAGAATGPGMNLGSAMATPAASSATVSRGRILMATPSAPAMQPFVHVPEWSNMLTRIACSKGMLTSERIDVYVSNNIALLRGAVRSSADRDTLANVLSLEPGVWQIDNRLVVKNSGDLSSNNKNP